ncbi:MAG: type II toxin-antitoxin system Phd/YefM family antitoxin [Rickettsiales bacterium]|nr:type II toxin-antitoxin system Phd/YefM family antitoxin [Rickettsiales bacterium]
MTYFILSDIIASISELKKHPMQVLNQAKGKPIAILNRNQPVCYCITPAMYEAIIEKLEDEELASIINMRTNEKEIDIDINDL